MKKLVAGLALAAMPVLLGAEPPTVTRPQARIAPSAQPLVDTGDENRAPSPGGSPALPEASAATPDPATSAPPHISGVRPPARSGYVPRTRWQHKVGNVLWTRAALSALKAHGKPLVDMVPGDIDDWCPAYADAPDRLRRAFWVGFLSALSKYESTYKARAVGGGGRWYGLLQIQPSTARAYQCNVGTGDGLMNGAANLSCAVRIMAHTVPRDGVIYGPGGKGVAADWGPLRSAAKRGEMTAWLRRQQYCERSDAIRPRGRLD